MSTLYRNKEWRNILDELVEETGISIKQIAEYIDVPYNGKETSFYAKLPQKRKKYIGIGMALGQPLEVINDWILKFSSKRRLYVKDVSEDLIWIYLIGLNCKAWAHTHRNNTRKFKGPGVNYFRMYEECQNAAYVTYRQLWDEVILSSLDTADLEVRLDTIGYDDKFEGLKEFIFDNMDSFKTAYTKPRKMLDRYVNCILRGLAAGKAIDEDENETVDIPVTPKLKLNWLRGFLDDSMINYLSGSSETHHVIDRKHGVRTLGTKHIPSGRKTHISMCLALGMNADEVNQYLELMGFAPLRGEDRTESVLAKSLDAWEKEHPLQRALKNYCMENKRGSSADNVPHASGNSINGLSNTEMLKAAESMLQLRLDLRDRFAKHGLAFPYYSEKRKVE